MNRHIVDRVVTGAVLCAPIIACTPDTRVARAADAVAKADVASSRYAAAARDRLARHRATAAVTLAEKAVAASPSSADARVLLGQSYLAAGRFASAEAALRDALTLAPDQPRARLALALARTGLGRGDDAITSLSGLRGRISDADLGLALALAGDRQAGVALLVDLVRAGKSDVRARQNLAFAFALDGRWGEARGMAMQDTTSDRINDQIAGWAAVTGAGREPQQVASILGTAPAIGDPGQPVRLALAAPDAEPVALAATAISEPIGEPVPVRLADAVPTSLPMPAIGSTVSGIPALVAAPAPRVPALLRRVAFLPASRPPSQAAVAPGPVIRAFDRGGWVVQLGAFSSMASLSNAWTEASRLAPRVATFAPVRGRTSVSGAVLMRLSVGPVSTRDEATGICRQIKSRGGACFVRQSAGDAPMRWARRDVDAARG